MIRQLTDCKVQKEWAGAVTPQRHSRSAERSTELTPKSHAEVSRRSLSLDEGTQIAQGKKMRLGTWGWGLEPGEEKTAEHAEGAEVYYFLILLSCKSCYPVQGFLCVLGAFAVISFECYC